jgi:hypothetical protein
LAVSRLAGNSRYKRNQSIGSRPIVPRRTARIASNMRPPQASRLIVALAVAALCLRLVWPVASPSVAPTEATSLTALIGEHALCLAQPASAAQAPNSGDSLPAPSGGHHDHDHSLCCLWHAAGGFLVPQAATVAHVAFVQIAPPIAAPSGFLPASQTGPSRARGPPADV